MEKAIPTIAQNFTTIKTTFKHFKVFGKKYQKCFYNSKMNYFKPPRYRSFLYSLM